MEAILAWYKSKNMNYIISYDISDDRLRLKIAKHLLANGCFRLQKSVFIAPKFHPHTIKTLKQEVIAFLNCPETLDTDSILCFQISAKQLSAIWWQHPKPSISFEFSPSEWF
jgi:CRISPR-associated endonuclease Cas2